MKKFLSLVTAIVMTVSLCIMPVYAQTYEEAAADAQMRKLTIIVLCLLRSREIK